jgi:hypothetical protein
VLLATLVRVASAVARLHLRSEVLQQPDASLAVLLMEHTLANKVISCTAVSVLSPVAQLSLQLIMMLCRAYAATLTSGDCIALADTTLTWRCLRKLSTKLPDDTAAAAAAAHVQNMSSLARSTSQS